MTIQCIVCFADNPNNATSCRTGGFGIINDFNFKKTVPMDFSLTSEKLAEYQQTAQENWQKSQPKRESRRQNAWKLAQLASTLLKEQFGATKVMVFGSLVREDCFTLWSDVDIAAWGIFPQDTFRAMGAVRDLDDTIEVNLVDVGTCNSELLNNILQEGIVL